MAPAFDLRLQARAEAMIQNLLDDLDYIGVMALELFLMDGELLANEFAPRVQIQVIGVSTAPAHHSLKTICAPFAAYRWVRPTILHLP